MKIFISHSSKTPEARQQISDLAAYLESLGYTVWYDKQLESTGGQVWWDNILKHHRDSDVFVFALTPAALASFPCELEYTYADMLKKPVLPVLVEALDDTSLPVELEQIQFVDFRQQSEQQKSALKQSLAGLRAAKLPKPVPPAPEPPTRDSELYNVYQKLRAQTLSRHEQHDLLTRLRIALKKTPNSAVMLLRKLDRREDLVRDVSSEIQSILADYHAKQPKRSPITSIAAIIAVLVIIGLVGSFIFNAMSNRSASPTPTTDIASAITDTPTTEPTQTFTPEATATPQIGTGGGTGKIAFVRDGDIWICSVDNCESDAHVLCETNDIDEATPSWSPDGKMIAFRFVRGNASGINVMKVDQSENCDPDPRTLTGGVDSNPTWSPDGQQIAFRRMSNNKGDIYTVKVDYDNRPSPTLLTNDSASTTASDLTPKWSEDGRYIVFASDRGSNFGIWKISLSDNNITPIVDNGAANYHPAILPKSLRLVYSTDIGTNDGYAIHTVSMTDPKDHSVLVDDGMSNLSSDISPDEEWIAFAASPPNERNKATIYIVREVGGKPQKLTEGDMPDWQPLVQK